MLDLEELLDFAESHMLNPELKDGIHGVKHWRRTAMIAEMIGAKLGWADLEAGERIVPTAAVFHDIGRVNDSGDLAHGYRGAGYLLKLMNGSWPSIFGDICYSLTDYQWGRVLDIIIHHCDLGPGTSDKMKIVKDADKCDRFRLSDEGPDPTRLALDVTRELLPEIKEFVRANL